MPDFVSPFDWKPSEQTDERVVASSRPARPAQFSGVRPPSDPETIWSALRRGALNRCPACGAAKLFASFLKPVEQCRVCQEDWTRHNADDFPPYIVILLLGHVVVTGMTSVEVAFHPVMWVQLAIWIPATIALAVGSIQPVKGGVIALQWWYRLGDFQKRRQCIEPLSQDPGHDVPLEIRMGSFVASASLGKGRSDDVGSAARFLKSGRPYRYPADVASDVVVEKMRVHR